MTPFSLNVKGRLVEYDRPLVMGVINATPDSFHAASRAMGAADVAAMAARMAAEGADIIDVGAFSTRPGASEVSAGEEIARLDMAIPMVKACAPSALVSVDTFRAEVARHAVADLGADMVNDVAGGNLDPLMFDTVAELKVPYVLGHMRGTVADMMEYANYDDVARDVLSELGERLGRLALMGVSDVMVDPGFGFSKTLDQNYALLHNLKLLELLHRPLTVGFSRKSMITKLLDIKPDEALNATTALNALALDRGAAILRVHDVAAAVQTVKIFSKTSAL